MGTTAMKAATRPEPTCCSARAVRPMPNPSISAPTAAAWAHWRAVGQAPPRSVTHPNSKAPAHRKRVPIWKKGGKLASASLIAR